MKNYYSIEDYDTLHGKFFVQRWDCGCQVQGKKILTCDKHMELPPIIRKLTEPVRIDASGRGSVNPIIHVTVLNMDTDDIKAIRRRVEDALRKGGTGQILRCAEILGVKIL